MDIIEILDADRDQETALEGDHPQRLPTEDVIDLISSENEDDDRHAGVDCAGEGERGDSRHQLDLEGYSLEGEVDQREGTIDLVDSSSEEEIQEQATVDLLELSCGCTVSPVFQKLFAALTNNMDPPSIVSAHNEGALELPFGKLVDVLRLFCCPSCSGSILHSDIINVLMVVAAIKGEDHQRAVGRMYARLVQGIACKRAQRSCVHVRVYMCARVRACA